MFGLQRMHLRKGDVNHQFKSMATPRWPRNDHFIPNIIPVDQKIHSCCCCMQRTKFSFPWLQSYANALISTFEDPEKILEQTVLEMTDDLTKMRQATAQVRISSLPC